MSNFESINSGALNSAGNATAEVVFLPDAVTSIELRLIDRTGADEIGDVIASTTFDASGDLSRLKSLGDVYTEVGLVHTARITAFAAVYIGDAVADVLFPCIARIDVFPTGKLRSVSAAFSAAVTGKLANMRSLEAATTLTFDETANLRRNAMLQASELFRFNLNGNIANKPFLQAASSVSFDCKATLRNTKRLRGASGVIVLTDATLTRQQRGLIGAVSSGIAFDIAANLSLIGRLKAATSFVLTANATTLFDARRPLPPASTTLVFEHRAMISIVKRLRGSSGVTFDVDGLLQNNALGRDLPQNIMYREPSNNLMVRV